MISLRIIFLVLLIGCGPKAYSQDGQQRTQWSLTLENGYSLHFEAVQVDITRHSLVRHNGAVVLFDECPVFGTDGDVPRTMLTRAFLLHNKHRIPLEVSCMFDPWTAGPKGHQFSLRETGSGVMLRGFFSDAAGLYAAEWLIIDHLALRTLITDDPILLYEYLAQ